MIDVGRDDGAAARDLGAHEFRRDEGRDRGAKAFAVGERRLGALELLLTPEVFALGDIDHFLGDDAGPRKFELRHGLAVLRPHRLRRVGEGAREMLARDIAVIDRLDRPAFIFLDAAALLHPFRARARQARFHVDRDRGIGIRPGGVVERQRRLAGGGSSATSRNGTRRSGAASGRE